MKVFSYILQKGMPKENMYIFPSSAHLKQEIHLWVPPMRWVNMPLAGPVLPHSLQVYWGSIWTSVNDTLYKHFN